MTPKDKPGLDPDLLQTVKELGEMVIGGRLVKYSEIAEDAKTVKEGEA